MALWYLCNINERQCWEQQSILQMTEKCYLIFIYLSFTTSYLNHEWAAIPMTLYIKARLNCFTICFNMRSTLCWTKCRGRLNWSFNIVESIKMLKARWKCVESNLNWFKLSFNVTSTFLLFLKTLNDVETVWTLLGSSNLCPTSVQLLLNESWVNVETV